MCTCVCVCVCSVQWSFDKDLVKMSESDLSICSVTCECRRQLSRYRSLSLLGRTAFRMGMPTLLMAVIFVLTTAGCSHGHPATQYYYQQFGVPQVTGWTSGAGAPAPAHTARRLQTPHQSPYQYQYQYQHQYPYPHPLPLPGGTLVWTARVVPATVTATAHSQRQGQSWSSPAQQPLGLQYPRSSIQGDPSRLQAATPPRLSGASDRQVLNSKAAQINLGSRPTMRERMDALKKRFGYEWENNVIEKATSFTGVNNGYRKIAPASALPKWMHLPARGQLQPVQHVYGLVETSSSQHKPTVQISRPALTMLPWALSAAGAGAGGGGASESETPSTNASSRRPYLPSPSTSTSTSTSPSPYDDAVHMPDSILPLSSPPRPEHVVPDMHSLPPVPMRGDQEPHVDADPTDTEAPPQPVTESATGPRPTTSAPVETTEIPATTSAEGVGCSTATTWPPQEQETTEAPPSPPTPALSHEPEVEVASSTIATDVSTTEAEADKNVLEGIVLVKGTEVYQFTTSSPEPEAAPTNPSTTRTFTTAATEVIPEVFTNAHTSAPSGSLNYTLTIPTTTVGDQTYAVASASPPAFTDSSYESTDSPTDAASDASTDAPTDAPTDAANGSPTDAPNAVPVFTFTGAPSKAPNGAYTDAPTVAPADSYTDVYTDVSIAAPSDASTDAYSDAAADAYTDATNAAPADPYTDVFPDVSTAAPTDAYTDALTDAAADAYTHVSTNAPADAPSDAPPDAYTDALTDASTAAPSDAPTDAPADASTSVPSDAPTDTYTDAPTDAPTDASTTTPAMTTQFTTELPLASSEAPGAWYSTQGMTSPVDPAATVTSASQPEESTPTTTTAALPVHNEIDTETDPFTTGVPPVPETSTVSTTEASPVLSTTARSTTEASEVTTAVYPTTITLPDEAKPEPYTTEQPTVIPTTELLDVVEIELNRRKKPSEDSLYLYSTSQSETTTATVFGTQEQEQEQEQELEQHTGATAATEAAEHPSTTYHDLMTPSTQTSMFSASPIRDLLLEGDTDTEDPSTYFTDITVTALALRPLAYTDTPPGPADSWPDSQQTTESLPPLDPHTQSSEAPTRATTTWDAQQSGEMFATTPAPAAGANAVYSEQQLTTTGAPEGDGAPPRATTDPAAESSESVTHAKAGDSTTVSGDSDEELWLPLRETNTETSLSTHFPSLHTNATASPEVETGATTEPLSLSTTADGGGDGDGEAGSQWDTFYGGGETGTEAVLSTPAPAAPHPRPDTAAPEPAGDGAGLAGPAGQVTTDRALIHYVEQDQTTTSAGSTALDTESVTLGQSAASASYHAGTTTSYGQLETTTPEPEPDTSVTELSSAAPLSSSTLAATQAQGTHSTSTTRKPVQDMWELLHQFYDESAYDEQEGMVIQDYDTTQRSTATAAGQPTSSYRPASEGPEQATTSVEALQSYETTSSGLDIPQTSEPYLDPTSEAAAATGTASQGSTTPPETTRPAFTTPDTYLIEPTSPASAPAPAPAPPADDLSRGSPVKQSEKEELPQQEKDVAYYDGVAFEDSSYPDTDFLFDSREDEYGYDPSWPSAGAGGGAGGGAGSTTSGKQQLPPLKPPPISDTKGLEIASLVREVPNTPAASNNHRRGDIAIEDDDPTVAELDDIDNDFSIHFDSPTPSKSHVKDVTKQPAVQAPSDEDDNDAFPRLDTFEGQMLKRMIPLVVRQLRTGSITGQDLERLKYIFGPLWPEVEELSKQMTGLKLRRSAQAQHHMLSKLRRLRARAYRWLRSGRFQSDLDLEHHRARTRTRSRTRVPREASTSHAPPRRRRPSRHRPHVTTKKKGASSSSHSHNHKRKPPHAKSNRNATHAAKPAKPVKSAKYTKSNSTLHPHPKKHQSPHPHHKTSKGNATAPVTASRRKTQNSQTSHKTRGGKTHSSRVHSHRGNTNSTVALAGKPEQTRTRTRTQVPKETIEAEEQPTPTPTHALARTRRGAVDTDNNTALDPDQDQDGGEEYEYDEEYPSDDGEYYDLDESEEGGEGDEDAEEEEDAAEEEDVDVDYSPVAESFRVLNEGDPSVMELYHRGRESQGLPSEDRPKHKVSASLTHGGLPAIRGEEYEEEYEYY